MHKLSIVALAATLIACGLRSPPELIDAGYRPAVLPTHPPVVPLPSIDPVGPAHKPVPPHPLVARCVAQEKDTDWEHLNGCLTAAGPDLDETLLEWQEASEEERKILPEKWAKRKAALASTPATIDAGHRLKGPSPLPPVNNPSWLLPEWDFDPASRLATCSDSNTCVTSASPCCTFQQIESRFGTRAEVFRQTTSVFQHSSHAVNPAVDEIVFTPRVQNGAVATFQCDFIQVCSGTLSGVTQLNRGYPDTAISATLCAGLTQPTKITVVHSTGTCDLWIDTNTSGNTWSLTHYQDAVSGSDQLCGIANGDSYTATVPINSNIRYWDPVWEDLADLPDSRPQMVGCNAGVGINTGAGADTAQVYIGLNGSLLNEVSFSSSTMVQQTRLTHGSRAFGSLQNVFFSDNSPRTTISTAGPSVQGVGSSGNPVKLIDIFGGRLYGPIMNNVSLRGDVRVVSGGGTASASGTIVYANAYAPSVKLTQGYVQPNDSSGGILYGASAGWFLFGGSTIVCNSPAATNCPIAGAQLDGTYDGYAIDDGVTPARQYVHVSLLGSTLWQALDGTIASGGCGGHCIGRGGSQITLLNAIPTTPVAAFAAGTGIGLTALTTGTSQTISNTGATSVTGAGSTSCSPTAGAVTCTTSNSVSNGLTGDTTLTAHATLLGEGTGAMSSVGPCTTNQVPLGVTNADPVCGAVALSVGAGNGLTCNAGPAYTCALATPVVVSNGGTGSTSLTAHDMLVGNGTGNVTLVSPSTSGLILTSNGTGSDPSFQANAALSTTPSTILSGINHGGSVGTSNSYATFATVTLVVANGVVATIDCKAAAHWSFSFGGSTQVAQLNWGISQDSTAAPTTVRSLGQNSLPGNVVDGAMVESYPGTSAGSHTYRVLAETAASIAAGESSGLSADLLCLQH